LKSYFIIIVTLSLASCNTPHARSAKESLEYKAFGLYKNKHYDEAILCLDTLINLDSTRGEYYYKRGYSYDQITDAKKATADFQKAISLNYEVAGAYYHLALDAMQDEKDSLALFYFDKVLKADPTRYPGVIFLIKACRRNIEFRKTDAWKDFEEFKNRRADSIKSK
jgi:tetratricopeptide (TPR) repeat protein